MATDKRLTDDQKKYIEEKHGNMSDKHIAIKLGLPRHLVKNYVRSIVSVKSEVDPPKKVSVFERLYTPKTAKIAAALAFVVILIIAADLRGHTFNLPHFRGDEHHYAGLAFKLDTQGINGYNLSGINLYGSTQSPNLIQIAPAQDKGQILKDLAAGGITYYDEPLHHIPFGFPMAIMISHKMFAFGEPYFMLAIPNDTELIQNAPPGVGLRYFRFDPAVTGKQFYLIIVPLAFSFLLISFTYFLAKRLYGSEIIALTAMFLMTISPVDILTSQKVWADDMTAALTLISAFLYILAVDKNKPLLALAAGLSCGLSAITKQSGAFVAFAIVIWHFASNFDKLLKKETFLKTVFDKNLISFGLGAVLAAGYWFAKVTMVYGTPNYKPYQPDLHKAATDWFAITANRPKTLYLLGMPYQNPLFALAYLAPFMLAVRKKEFKSTLLLIIWGTVFLYIFSVYLGNAGKEERYMLPAYPAFAILGAYMANHFRSLLDKRFGVATGTVVLVAALFVSVLWSVPMAFETLFTGGALIMKPF